VTEARTQAPTGATGNQPIESKPQPGAAKSVIERFYGLINSGQYERAWRFVPANVRANAGSFKQWKAGYRSTVSSNPRNLVISSVGAQGRTALITLDLHATDVDACSGDRVTQLFSGTWTLRATNGGWEPQSISFHKVSGGTPTLSASDCAPSSAGGTGTTTTSSRASCTPGYSPCLTPASDYDCAGGTGDGPEYTGEVQVTGSDPYGLDIDGDGVGCES